MTNRIEKVIEETALQTADRVAKETSFVAISEHQLEVLTRRVTKEAIDDFCDRLGIDDLREWHEDRVWLRNRREVEKAVIKQGFIFTVVSLLGAIGAAVFFALKNISKL